MNSSPLFNVMDIIRGTTVDGPGFRTAIYLAGCPHHCVGCHNPSTWDPDSGIEMSLETILSIISEEDFNVTLTGGDPLMFPDKVIVLAKEIKRLGYNIWLYTGYTYEEITRNPRLNAVLEFIDVLVDGPFIETLKNPDLLFRGSSNQNIIYLHGQKHLL